MKSTKETQQSLLGWWRVGGKCRLSTKLSPGGFTRCWGMEDLVRLPGMDLRRICHWDLMWQGEIPRILTDLVSRYITVPINFFMPMYEGSTLKKVMILCVGSGLMGGWKICAWNMRASWIYRAKHLWSI